MRAHDDFELTRTVASTSPRLRRGAGLRSNPGEEGSPRVRAVRKVPLSPTPSPRKQGERDVALTSSCSSRSSLLHSEQPRGVAAEDRGLLLVAQRVGREHMIDRMFFPTGSGGRFPA